MNSADEAKPYDLHLRTAAERQIDSAPLAGRGPAHPDEQLLHELQVHQVELEMQNETLRQKQVELEALRDRYVDLYDFAPVGYLTLTAHGMIDEVNFTACTLLGMERKNLLQRRFTALVIVEDQNRWMQHYLNVIESGRAGSVELALQRGDGTVFPALLDCVRTKVGAGETALRIALTDITERKQAESAIKESEEFSAAVLDAISANIAVLDGDGVIVAVNEAWRRFARDNASAPGMVARHSQLGANYLDICQASGGESTQGADEARTGIRAVLDGSLSSFSIDYPCHSPAAQRWFLMSVTPLGDKRTGAVVVYTNITERKQAESALFRYQNHLEQLVAERTRELQSMARQLLTTEARERRALAEELHDDLGQSLALAKLKLDALAEPREGQASADYLQDKKAIETLLSLAIASARSYSTQLRPLVLSQFGLVAALESLSQDLLRIWGLHVKLHLCGAVTLDETTAATLFRIVRELLLNILKHARVSEATLIMALDADSGVLEVTVTDEGIGFDIEQKLVPTSDSGYGLGSIRQRIGFIGGNMSIDSQVGHGTIVSLTLPLELLRQQ